MRFKTKLLGALGLVVALIGLLILATRPEKPAPEPVVATPEPANTNVGGAVQLYHSLFAPTGPETRAATNEKPVEVEETSTNVITNWEDKIDEVLKDDSESDEKAKKILAVFPTLPEEGQIEAVKHISNLLSDENYSQVHQYVTNTAMPSEVLDEFVADLLNRPDSIKLPTLLEIAQNPQHPGAADAKDILELYLEEDYGNDWGKWQQKLADFLKDNPD